MNRRLWFCLIVIATLLLAGCGGGSANFEKANQIYAIEASSAVTIGGFVKASESDITEGVKEIGASEGKLLKYVSGTESVIVMAFRFDSPDLASQAFKKLEGGTKIATDFYEIEAGSYRCLVSDVIYLASGSRNSVVTVIGGIAPSFSKTAAGTSLKTIKSSSGSVGAFAYDWFWSKEQKQDGRFGETSVTIDLPSKPVLQATLHVVSSYSQQEGSGRLEVFIRTEQQVTPPDADHNRGSWWVGNKAMMGEKVGDFETDYGNKEEWSTDITSFVNKYIGSKKFYIGFANHAQADIGINLVYIEVVP